MGRRYLGLTICAGSMLAIFEDTLFSTIQLPVSLAETLTLAVAGVFIGMVLTFRNDYVKRGLRRMKMNGILTHESSWPQKK